MASERDRLLQEAKACRDRQRPQEALAILARLESAHPRFSRLYQERGHCHILLRDGSGAIDALEQAVRLNPALPACWDMLQQLYRLRGSMAEAATAAQRAAALEQVPQNIVIANSLLADGDLDPAETVIRGYLRGDPDNAGAQRLLARIRKESGDLAEAERLLSSLLDRAPDYHAARFDYSAVLLQQQKHLAAREEARRLLRHEPDNRDYLKQYGAASIGMGDHEAVIDLYEKLLSSDGLPDPEVADLRMWRANALKVAGRQSEAVTDYRASLKARPGYGVAWFGLANLKTYRFTDADIADMHAAAVRPDILDMDRVYLGFALGKAHEDRRDHAAAWSCYARANAVRRTFSRYRPEGAEDLTGRLKRQFTAEFFADRAGWGIDDPSPVFILGLPRSGSTLIEQILASHSAVEGTQELTEIGGYAVELCGADPDCGLPLDPGLVEKLSRADARTLGERFLAETSAYRRLGRPFFIDKMPNNFWHIGLIQLILPGSTIIDIRRDPMGCGFSNFKQLFGTTNQEFSYDLDHIARNYRCYLNMMRHWNTVLPGRVLTVHYEDVVENLDETVRRMLEHCRLPFEPACITFHETRRSVRTPSSEQVRQPIGREGLTQWQHFSPWLEPLREALGDALTGYRD